jgi:uncharacterized protein (DUF2235 family)
MAKNIIFCADGTWNNPDDELIINAKPDPSSNVYKLFSLLDGRMVAKTKAQDITGEILEREKKLTDSNSNSLQIAKYINGVGNGQNKIQELIGGGFGTGLIKRIVRGYTFISRNYEAGDHIHIIGFSRGAYTARALAGLIASQGLLANKFERGAEESYKMGGQVWFRYRKAGAERRKLLTQFMEAMQDLPSFFTSGSIKDSDLNSNVNIATVAVWDTVGSLGVPKFNPLTNTLEDAYRFADIKLSSKVDMGLHAIALDEQRLLFTPTFWDAAANVKQVVFPGAHSDVGGGYPIQNNESGLSDGALLWMVQQLTARGVLFSDAIQDIKPDPTAPAHREWKFADSGLGTRKFNAVSGVVAHQSVLDRKNASSPVFVVGEAPKKYNPENWPH